jgi:putative transposase
MSVDLRRAMIEPAHRRLSISTESSLLRISRSSYCYAPALETDEMLSLMAVIDATLLNCPWYGSRQMARHLHRSGREVGRRHARWLMAKMDLMPIYQRPRTSAPHPVHRVYPYLLRKLVIGQPNQVWSADVTYIPMRRGFLYLVRIMDWATRKVLVWRLSNRMDVGFYVTGGAGPLRQARDLQHRPRAASSRRRPSPACCARLRSASEVRMRPTSMPSRPVRSCGWFLAGVSPITTPSVRTRALPEKPRSRPIGGPRNQIMGACPPDLMINRRHSDNRN